ncbi:NUDIX domain-containing protein [Colwellia sp. Arc7-D]|uniref:NUDIX domain-containing protein n=1 Tax=Colwellia sp. Arc7-D TaxID=2161872 RepID=UPI000D3448BA|nr:NUDIX domain-containing protein [Colwellia sp. Arc7-D]AWB58620.1 ADP-ribose pyrophosphatase [Colwellia sp. Arc7-D]
MSITEEPLLRFGLADVEVRSRVRKYQGFFALDEYQFRHKLYAGGYSKVLTREVFERGNAVGLLPYDPKNDTVVLIEQFRAGALQSKTGPWQLELIAGMFSENEVPQDVAIREAKEEANIDLAPENVIKVMDYLSSSGGMTECIHLYCACVDSDNISGIFGLASEDEDILVHVISRKNAEKLLAEGKILNAATIITLQWLALNIDKFKSNWK